MSGFSEKDFRAELVKIMPGYSWVVHKSSANTRLVATGTQSSGFNRLSTLSVERTDRNGTVRYEAMSSGFGRRAPWLHTNADGSLARCLRGLQGHYQNRASTYAAHAAALQRGRELVDGEAQP